MNENNPWISIWANPKQTIRSIVSTNPKKRFFILAAIFGLSFCISNAMAVAVYQNVSIVLSLLVALIISPFIGAVVLYIGAWFLWGIGKWFNGQAPFQHVLAAYAWSRVPTIIVVVMWFLLLAIGGPDSIVQYKQDASISFVVLISLIVQIWSIVLLIQSLQEVQGYSVWKAFGNWLVAVIVYFAILFFISYVINLLFRL